MAGNEVDEIKVCCLRNQNRELKDDKNSSEMGGDALLVCRYHTELSE